MAKNIATPTGHAKENFIVLLGKFDIIFRKGTPEEKRLFVSNIIKSIVVNNETIKIYWRV